jgi:hypothetical protein
LGNTSGYARELKFLGSGDENVNSPMRVQGDGHATSLG